MPGSDHAVGTCTVQDISFEAQGKDRTTVTPENINDWMSEIVTLLTGLCN